MKCGAYVKYVDAKRKGSGENYRKPEQVLHPYGVKLGWFTPTSDMEVCDGEIKAKVDAVEEPEWGGTYTSLEINYTCNKCKCSYFPELPGSSDALSKFLTERILEIPESVREIELDRIVTAEREYRSRIERLSAEMNKPRRGSLKQMDDNVSKKIRQSRRTR